MLVKITLILSTSYYEYFELILAQFKINHIPNVICYTTLKYTVVSSRMLQVFFIPWNNEFLILERLITNVIK